MSEKQTSLENKLSALTKNFIIQSLQAFQDKTTRIFIKTREVDVIIAVDKTTKETTIEKQSWMIYL